MFLDFALAFELLPLPPLVAFGAGLSPPGSVSSAGSSPSLIEVFLSVDDVLELWRHVLLHRYDSSQRDNHQPARSTNPDLHGSIQNVAKAKRVDISKCRTTQRVEIDDLSIRCSNNARDKCHDQLNTLMASVAHAIGIDIGGS